jgi:hypothetical protein
MRSEHVKAPRRGIDRITQSAIRMQRQAMGDRPALESMGFPADKLHMLGVAARATLEAHHRLLATRSRDVEAWRKRKHRIQEAKVLKSRLRPLLRYAYRDSPDILGHLRRLLATGRQTRLVLDLAGIARVIRQYPEPLVAVSFDFGILDTLTELAASLPMWLSQTRRTSEYVDALHLRDTAYSYLIASMRELRECAMAAFWDDPEHARAYSCRSDAGEGGM